MTPSQASQATGSNTRHNFNLTATPTCLLYNQVDLYYYTNLSLRLLDVHAQSVMVNLEIQVNIIQVQ